MSDDGDDSGDGSGGDSGWAQWNEEHPSQYNNEGQGGGKIAQTPQTGYNSGQQHTMDIAAQHGIQTEHLVSTSTYNGYSPPPAPTAPTPGVKQGTVPVKSAKPAKAQKGPAEKVITKPFTQKPLQGLLAKVSGGMPGPGVLGANTGGLVK